MKKLWVVIALLCLVFVGCSNEKVSRVVKKEVTLDAGVKGIGNKIFLYGNSNLPEGTFIKVVFKEIDANQSIAENTVKVDKDGKYNWETDKPKLDQEYELNVMFLPEKQSKEVQQKYGKTGEAIDKESIGFIKYEVEGKTYTGIKMYSRVHKITKEENGQSTQGQSTRLSEVMQPPLD
ncbi:MULTISPECIES: hypothetical protein [Bacillus]|uniref:Lipoprotein n=1 Tax=Bacillus cereus TaxID=1396 RepID=A0A2C1LS46_BACCE|nr:MULTISPECIES: hypothetical protein [Bacillus]PER21062.1 hypothetical protein CN476_24100 [Bacillus cereus]PFA63380.1 hypothetical protein CN402_06765 [Bacillus sp. AFS015896]PGL86777.1 hypothetical protein CN931_05685 [Bacillus sp. AFS054943]PGU00481.1 hypothetical protein COD19_15270 [Bacillus cereus]PGX09973.1 hypothetical protein COE07_18695 [Bacillus sp. AFS033286]